MNEIRTSSRKTRVGKVVSDKPHVYSIPIPPDFSGTSGDTRGFDVRSIP